MSEECQDALLDALAGVVDARRAIENTEARLVARLRALDPPVSWREIGELLGVTGEAVRKRFISSGAGPRA